MSNSSREAWDAGRPIFNRLPEWGYQDNQAVDALTQWADMRLVEKRDILEQFWRTFVPALCPVERLEYAAYVVGFSGDLWRSSWSEPTKRAVLTVANDLLKARGSLQALQQIIAVLENPAKLWSGSALSLSFPMPGRFGSNAARVYLRMGRLVARESEEWRNAEYVVQQWVAAPVRSRVCYERFYLGLSVLGDPMFS
jgi:hypothetical protein